MARKKQRRRRSAKIQPRVERETHYTRLRHPLTPQSLFSDDEIENIHNTALRVLQELGIRFHLPEARALLTKAGATESPGEMVHIGSDMVKAALRTAPDSFRLRASNSAREVVYEPGAMIFSAGSGCPNATDMVRGRRPGSLRDYCETLKLQQSFDVIHLHGPSAEPQDVPINIRHYAMMRSQYEFGDKPVFVYARGRGQVQESFEITRLANQLSDDEFLKDVWCKTIINSNSPRLIDNPMAQGIIDFARAGQLAVITPFCLAGAMAPVTAAGALVLQHAEALACITLAQVAKPGAPVSYGGFSSNVDMKSGAPAFGTPEHVQMQIGSGQLARLIGLPWRSATGSASNIADMQAAGETHMALWGAMAANATLTVHAAGWLEGGLTFGYEKFINDIEALQTVAELCKPPPATDDDLGFAALADVPPGGHFFATEHTMQRYKTAFYQPLVADLSNFGQWTEAGSNSATERAVGIWQKKLRDFEPPPGATERADRIAEYISVHEAAGGSAPVD